jgi:2-oxo-4-hydroxy-4-carboxy-5-ureidoimidazoline decarboxylase
MTPEAINALPREAFVDLLGGIFEHSPWVAEQAFAHRPFASSGDLCAAMNRAVERATVEEKLALLRAHPDLGTRARVSASSASEQAGAGLNQLTQEEYDRLTELNARYREKFGFPFLYAVKGSGKSAILEALQARSENSPEAEFEEALQQVFRIAQFRLQELFKL